MATNTVEITSDINIGGSAPIVLFSGPCVIEGEDMTLRHAEKINRIAEEVGMPFVFKASYDKANRSSYKSYRGPGIEEGLRILSLVKSEIGVPVITDAHSAEEMSAIGEVVDVVQIPAFLCRQTDLIQAAARTGCAVNIKKGQFIAPEDVANIVDKVKAAGSNRVMITERGSSFGYRRLVVDFTGIAKMREMGFPVVFDATHSVQIPGGMGEKSGGESHLAPSLAWAAAAVGIDGLFVEVHENPGKALSDGPNMIPLSRLGDVLKRFLSVADVTRRYSTA